MRRIFFLSLLISFSLYGQNFLKGEIIDNYDGTKLKYVSIALKNKNIGTYSNENGLFEIEYDKNNDTLIFSTIGYKDFFTSGINEDVLTISMQRDTMLLNEVVLKPIIKKCKKDKIKFKKTDFYNSTQKHNETLFEGTIYRRKITLKNKYLCGFNFEVKSNYETTIIIRPHLTDINNNQILLNNYTVEKKLKEGKIEKVEFSFNENILTENKEFYIGIEAISLPNNKNYLNNVMIFCSADDDVSSEVLSNYNFIQQNGLNQNFDRKLETNIKVEVFTSK